ncbi:MAG: hypothetical protein JWN26_534 [Candidatus Saccharibacteria bacterium]|jgi:hypothetical protein|nr:hypothetical protein [Candidatus Saccharibacteria bacterium]
MPGPDFGRLAEAGYFPDVIGQQSVEPSADVKHDIGHIADLLDVITQPIRIVDVNEHGYPTTKPLPIIKSEQIAGEL